MNLPSALLAVPVSAALGLLAVVTPAFFMEREPHGVAPLFPIVHVAVEGFAIPAALGLFCAGLVTELVLRAPFWVIGPSSMLAFPVMAIAEMLVEPRSHSLFPFEFFFYGAASLLAAVGALLGESLFRVINAVRKNPGGA